jgi:hypothetical protein
MRFAPGQSGNPAGRPPGSRNKTTLQVEEMLAERAEAAVTKILDRAETGDPAAMRLCMERVLPTGTNRPLALELPPVTTPDDVIAATGVVMNALAQGAISPRETVCLLTVVERLARIAERVQQMKERHAAWRDAPSPASEADVGLAVLAKEAARAALEAALEQEGAAASLYSPVNSGAESDRTGGGGLYSPVNLAGKKPAAPAEGSTAGVAAGGGAGQALYFPVNPSAAGSILRRRKRELLGTVAVGPLREKAGAAADRELHGTPSRGLAFLQAIGTRDAMQVNAA